MTTLKSLDRYDNIIPSNELMDDQYPGLAMDPANWLPRSAFKHKQTEEFYSIPAGCPIGVDPDGQAVPAGLALRFAAGGSTVVVSYTERDIGRTINVATGNLVTVAGDVTASTLASSGFKGNSARPFAISNPIGVTRDAVLGAFRAVQGDSATGANTVLFNYETQGAIRWLTTGRVMQYPQVPGRVSSAEALTFSGSGNVKTATATNKPMAKNTVRTPVVFSGGSSADLFVTEVDSLAKVNRAGKFHINYETGKISVFSAGSISSVAVTYSHYDAAPSAVSFFTSAIGDLRTGDLVTFDANSNFVKATAANLGLGDTSGETDVAETIASGMGRVLGQVLKVDRETNNTRMDMVHTGFVNGGINSAGGLLPGTNGQRDQQPGSATGGAPNLINWAGAADSLVYVRLY